ncbi:hypothetical protein [Amaricoccus sp.]|uniref:hypothetical protein n=1 Tax=Amaricoccus sp. TaxID=1872485 RepID=UPI001B599EA8|nr:hypothetical protein [Amaricoccus sp.]MBP7241684.1 hypothetical protein [Amaricoccus sp.]
MRVVLMLGACLALAACDAPPPADPVADDSARCAAAGFAPGSEEMARCMRTASQERQGDADRAAWQAAQDQRTAEREQARQDRKDAADDAAWRKHSEEVQEMMGMPAVGYDRDAIIGDDDQPPTASRIPGMECTGIGDDESCDALSSD